MHRDAAPSDSARGLLRKREVARLLAVSERAVERLVASGRLARVRILGAVRFRWTDVEAIITKGVV